MIMLLHFAIKPVVSAFCVLIFFHGEFNYYYHNGSSSVAQVQQKLGSKNLVTMVADTDNNNIFENLAGEFSNAFKRFEYIVNLNAKEIFPNDTLKQDVVTNYKSSTYSIST
jgi:hypothetical protein